MGILSRFKDIMSSNINALLDKAEDPEKMVDECLRNLNSDLGKCKAETAAVMADEQRAKRELDNCDAEIAKMADYAQKAVNAGNDDDARQFLQKKANLTTERASYEQAYEQAKTNSANMKSMHSKLTKDISELEEKRTMIKSKVRMAKAQQHINEITSSANDSADSISAFERMSQKADRMLDEANATSQLNAETSGSVESLEDKYDSPAAGVSSNVEDELAALKANKPQ